MKRKLFFVVLMLLILLVQSVQSMSSSNYKLDWFTPLTGSGGSASSPIYSISFTVGQTVNKTSTSPLYSAHMGYWAGIMTWFEVFIPVILKGQ